LHKIASLPPNLATIGGLTARFPAVARSWCSVISVLLGGSLKIKITDGGIQRSIFIVKHDGSIDFSINQTTAVQELWYFHVRIKPIKPQSRKLTFTGPDS